MPAILPVILTASHLVLVADTVPNFNIEPTCRAADQAGIGPGRDAQACRRDEREARATLEQDWVKYTAAERANCVRLTTLDGSPSYVEVLTCLEMAKEVREAPAGGRDKR